MWQALGLLLVFGDMVLDFGYLLLHPVELCGEACEFGGELRLCDVLVGCGIDRGPDAFWLALCIHAERPDCRPPTTASSLPKPGRESMPRALAVSNGSMATLSVRPSG